MTKSSKLSESLYAGDLKFMIKNEIMIDEFKSKMGDDKDIIVVSFIANDKEPAWDLMNFLEKGYSNILDADTSPGEMEDGNYTVFLEMERSENFPEDLVMILDDLEKLTTIKSWSFKYYKFSKEFDATVENLTKLPLTPERYIELIEPEAEESDMDEVPAEDDLSDLEDKIAQLPTESIDPRLNIMRRIAGIPEKYESYPDNEYTRHLQDVAHIKRKR